MSEIHQFSRMLVAALAALDEAANAEELAKAAEKRRAESEAKLAEYAAAHAKLKAESDVHLQTNLDRLNAETEAHNAATAELKKRHFALEQRGRDQIENASSTLTSINASIGAARKEKDELLVEIARLQARVRELAQGIG